MHGSCQFDGVEIQGKASLRGTRREVEDMPEDEGVGRGRGGNERQTERAGGEKG